MSQLQRATMDLRLSISCLEQGSDLTRLAASNLLQVILVSNNIKLGLLQDIPKEMIVGGHSFGKLLLRKNLRIDLPSNPVPCVAELHCNFGKRRLADDHHINVAGGLLAALRDGAVDESTANAARYRLQH